MSVAAFQQLLCQLNQLQPSEGTLHLQNNRGLELGQVLSTLDRLGRHSVGGGVKDNKKEKNARGLVITNNTIDVRSSSASLSEAQVHNEEESSSSTTWLSGIESLNLSANDIGGPLLSRGTVPLAHMSSLTSLDLANNKLTHIYRRWWHGLSTRLTSLNLSYNGLSGEMACGAFSTLGSLTTLDLSNNRIRTLPYECFQGTRTSCSLISAAGLLPFKLTTISVLARNTTTSRAEQAVDSQPGQQRDQGGEQAFVALGLTQYAAKS
jgi:Leucine-rich repeat (LRR) protein